MNPYHLDAARRFVAAHGHIVITTTASEGYGYAYTVGLSATGQPELIITGLPYPQSRMVLVSAVQPILADPHASIGSTYELANDSTVIPTFNVQLAPVGNQQCLTFLPIAVALYGPERVTARQLLFADFNRRMPTHPSYDHATLPQPLLNPQDKP